MEIGWLALIADHPIIILTKIKGNKIIYLVMNNK